MFDLIIIGASAAGTAAAVYASRAQMNFKVLAKDLGGEVANSGEVWNYPGFDFITGVELSQKFNAQLAANKIEPEVGFEATAVEKTAAGFVVIGQDANGAEKRYEAKAVIVATGVRPRHLTVPGEHELYQKGLSYCTTCDGPLFRNKTVVTIGGGNSALESVLMLAGLCPKVYSINKNPEFKGEQVYIEKVKALPNVEIISNAKTTKILGDQRVSGVEYQDSTSGETKSITADGIFVHAGILPNTDFLKGLDILTPAGFIDANLLMETKILGLFVAGDIVNIPYNQIAIATGQGVIALLTAQGYLNRLPHTA